MPNAIGTQPQQLGAARAAGHVNDQAVDVSHDSRHETRGGGAIPVSPLDFMPALTLEEMNNIDQAANSAGAARRCALAVLRLTGTQLQDWARSDGAQDSFVGALDSITLFGDQLERLLELARMAEARMLLIGERADLDLETSRKAEL